jgi:hypothetical protein
LFLLIIRGITGDNREENGAKANHEVDGEIDLRSVNSSLLFAARAKPSQPLSTAMTT